MLRISSESLFLWKMKQEGGHAHNTYTDRPTKNRKHREKTAGDTDSPNPNKSSKLNNKIGYW